MAKKEGKTKKKALCKLCKNDCLKDDFEIYRTLVTDSRYVCKKCGRTAHKKNNLCKPFALDPS